MSATATDKFLEVTEMAGQMVSEEQLARTAHRYYWAEPYVTGNDVLEVACGAGLALGWMAERARRVAAGDVSAEVLERAKQTYGSQIELSVFDAASIPYPDRSFDTIMLYEAIYYLPDADAFMRECARVLRPGGHVLIITANKDLYDFNPSPYTHKYYGTVELRDLCARHGFSCKVSGYVDVATVSMRQRILRPIKKIAVAFNLIPKTMHGKEFLKRLVFGRMIPMPARIPPQTGPVEPVTPVSTDVPDRRHKVLYCVGELQ